MLLFVTGVVGYLLESDRERGSGPRAENTGSWAACGGAGADEEHRRRRPVSVGGRRLDRVGGVAAVRAGVVARQ